MVNFWETRGGVRKSGVLEHKNGNISETRKYRGKVTMTDLEELTNALSNGTTPTPYGLLFPKIGGSQPHPKLPSLSGTDKATDFKFGRYIYRVHPNKRPLKILEKRELGRIQGLPNVLGTPIYLRNG